MSADGGTFPGQKVRLVRATWMEMTMRRFVPLLSMVALTGGCKKVVEAPEDLALLSGFLYGAWDSEDPEERAVALKNLETQLSSVDDMANAAPIDRSWVIEPLTDEEVEGLTRPDRPLENTVNVALAHASPWSVEDHARFQTELDQRPAEPTATRYNRIINAPADPACFVAEDCEILDTFNDMRRENLLVQADMELLKTFRWVPFTDDEDNERIAFYSRSWFEQSWPGDKGNATLLQSYSIDVWIEQPDGSTWRYQTLWSETDLGFAVGDGAVESTIRGGTNDAMFAGDQAIADLYHDGVVPEL